MVALTLSALLAALGPGMPDVRGATDCPSPEAVGSRLRVLLPVDGELPPGAWLEIAQPVVTGGLAAGGEFEVRMMTGTPPRALGVRRLSLPPSCDEAAQVVAVVAATWTANYQSPPLLGFGESPRHIPRAPARDAETPSPFLAGEIEASDDPAGGAARGLALGAELGLAAAMKGTAAPFVIAELDLRSRNAFGARLLAMAVGARTIELGSGQVAWRRLMAGAGVVRTWGTPAARLEIGCDVVAGATFIEGVGFAQNAGTTSFDIGAAPWVRAGAQLAAAPVTIWAGARGVAWAREQRVHVDLVMSSDALPRLDLLVGAGFTWTPDAWNRPRP